MNENERDWKLKYKYGIKKTLFHHYTILAQGVSKDIESRFNCPDGKAFMAMKIWAFNHKEAANLFQEVGNRIGFTTTGKIEIYKSDPQEPPQENPSVYNINFTPFK